MYRQRIRVVAVVALLSLQLLIPGAFWHGLAGHHDTVHCESTDGGVAISERHVHCPALDLVVQLAEMTGLPELVISSKVAFSNFFSEIPYIEKRIAYLHPLRGPPCLPV